MGPGGVRVTEGRGAAAAVRGEGAAGDTVSGGGGAGAGDDAVGGTGGAMPVAGGRDGGRASSGGTAAARGPGMRDHAGDDHGRGHGDNVEWLLPGAEAGPDRGA